MRRVRARGAGLEPVAARRRLERLLGGGLRPPGMPPGAIACVRRLGDPSPGCVDLAGDARPVPRGWTDAVEARLGELIWRAARPADGAVAPDAPAVVFADRAEMLAVLTRDAADGVAAARWWWAALGLQGHPAPVCAAWLEAPEHAAAAVERLAAIGRLDALAVALDRDAARAVASAAARAHGLERLAVLVSEAQSPPAPAGPPPPSAPAPPWAAVAPEAAPLVASGWEPALLVGVALTMRRRPSLGRTAAFAAAVGRWAAAVDRRAAAPRGDVDRTGTADPPAPAGGRGPAAPSRRRSPPAPRARAARGARRAHEPADGTRRAPRPEPPGRPRRPSAGASSRHTPSVEAQAGAGARASASGADAVSGARAPRGAASAGAAAERAPGFVATRTRLGGLFHLLNVALFLGLYGDFTQPRAPGIALSPWDLLDLLGAELLGARPRDPVWRLLADLSGRGPGGRAGAGFRAPGDLRAPAEWLAPFGKTGPWRWGADERRIRLRHPAGFAASDVRRRGPLDEQLRRELARHGARAVAGAPPRREARDRLDGWVAWLGAYVAARLCLALGVRRRREAVAVLLRRRASVLVTATEIELTFALADYPVAVRLAGLDRDPGWVPAAGRRIGFRFE
jgi:hypothetical protein